jgi:hypothetical protein
MSKPDTDTNAKKRKPWKPQTSPFIAPDTSDAKPHRVFQAVSFARSLLGEHTPQGAVAIATSYCQADPARIAFELGRALSFGWTDSGLKAQFTDGLRDGLKNGGGK